MSAQVANSGTTDASRTLRDDRRIVAATVVGTTIEWYDFFTYAAAAGLIFGELFFSAAGGTVGAILSFATVGISFLFRPLGAIIAGHLGDKHGRKSVLALTLIMMGVSTALIGMLPTASSIGVAAPILLILLRIVQGLSAGGEWGGAALMAVEHAPVHKRGLYGAGPQIGVPLGLLMSSGVLAIMAQIAPGEAFTQWGWRVPFLLSFVLIGIGYWVRRSVEESPVFLEIAERAEETKSPLLETFRKHWLLIIVAAFVFAGDNAVGYMTTGGFIQKYATNPNGPIGMEKGPVLWAVAISAFSWLVFTALAGWLSDKIGRRVTYMIGYAVLGLGVLVVFPLVKQGTWISLVLGLCALTVGLGLTYGPLSAFFAELFPASIRFSGVSVAYALGSILGGAFAPMIAQWLMSTYKTEWAVVVYLMITVVLGFIASAVLKDRQGIPLGPDHEAEQNVSPIRGVKSI